MIPAKSWRRKRVMFRKSFHPIGERLEIVQVHARQRAVRAGALASRAAMILHAEIALGRLADGFGLLIHHEGAVLIADVHHADGVVGTIVIASLAADAGGGIDDDLPGEGLAVDRARR